MKKKDVIEDLSGEGLKELIELISNKAGYKVDKKNKEANKVFVAVTNALSKVKICFYLTTEHLSGVEEIDEQLVKEINETQKKVNQVYLVSTKVISEGFKKKLSREVFESQLEYLDRDGLINYVEEFEIDIWRHQDKELLQYEENVSKELKKDTNLKKISVREDQLERLKKIFIEPLIYELIDDTESSFPKRKKTNLSQITEMHGIVIISGEAGIGKSTVLKKITSQFISENKRGEKKVLPIYIMSENIIDSDYSLVKAINNELKEFFTSDLNDLSQFYKIKVCLDSIDEFPNSIQKDIIESIKELSDLYSISFLIASRNQEKMITELSNKNVTSLTIEKFNNQQLEKFVTNFFPKGGKKSEYLLEALKDKRIIERLPMTPLTLSLITILFEERDFEIPATITDIYDNFNILILGKQTITTKLDFIDINFKQRILSYYGYFLLKSLDHSPLDRAEFYSLIKDFYSDKTISVEQGNLNDLLSSLIDNSAILTEKKGKIIFKHDSFMEYYASIEFFLHRRNEEDLLVENFEKHHWQNVAIFYAGKSKDMSQFLEKLNNRLSKITKLNDMFSVVMGIGYILQSLYETDSNIRKNSIDIALDLNVKTHQALVKLAGDKEKLFKNYSYGLISTISIIYFFENFNSITLKDPLKLSFEDFYNNFLDSEDETDGFKALKISSTLSSKRIGSENEFEKLVYESNFLNKPLLALLANFASDYLIENNKPKFKKDIANKVKDLNDPIRAYLKEPINKLRFTNQDIINPSHDVTILVEGKTDAIIIEHAYSVLTDGEFPYWKIRKKINGANDLAKTLNQLDRTFDSDDTRTFIGIFDNDSKGIQEFKGALNGSFQIEKDNKRIKKHENHNIYAIKLPIPESMDHYLNKSQHDNYFCIEHYFDIELLQDNSMLLDTPIPNVFKINPKAKKDKFAKTITELDKKEAFNNFLFLFEEIDRITGFNVNYNL
jgi:hypothetical protein